MDIQKDDILLTQHQGTQRTYRVVEPQAPYDSKMFIANRWLGSEWGTVRYAVHRDRVIGRA